MFQKLTARVLAEFLGAGILSLALYTILARTSFPVFTGAGLAVAYAMIVMIFGEVSGGHANPIVTLAQWSRSKIGTVDALVNIAAQMLGGLAAWGLIRYFMGHTLTSLAGPKFTWATFIAEAIGAAIFTFGIGAAVSMKVEGSKYATAAALSLFVGVLVASLGSNAILNPAAALGVQSWDWAYTTGPIIGGIVGINLYNLVFAGSWSNWGKKSVTARVSSRTTTKRKSSRRK